VPATQLTSPPSLGPLYARAAVTGPLHRGDTLPDSQYTLAEQTIDRAHLAEYQRVCGFRVADVLPPTYLHILAFPLSVALMTQRSFPFPLVGMVHIANTITVRRPVTAGDTFSFEVTADNLRPHQAGRQFDLVAQASIAGDIVWSSRSVYLRRGGGAGDGGRPARHPSPGPDAVRGSVAQVRVPDDIGRRYGAVSGDRNPIHLYALTARAFGFPKAIAHGMWLKARTLATLEGRLPESFTADVAFKTPVLLPSTILIGATHDDGAWQLDVRNAKSGKPHLSGTIT
jgi:acyl dehydratase